MPSKIQGGPKPLAKGATGSAGRRQAAGDGKGFSRILDEERRGRRDREGADDGDDAERGRREREGAEEARRRAEQLHRQVADKSTKPGKGRRAAAHAYLEELQKARTDVIPVARPARGGESSPPEVTRTMIAPPPPGPDTEPRYEHLRGYSSAQSDETTIRQDLPEAQPPVLRVNPQRVNPVDDRGRTRSEPDDE